MSEQSKIADRSEAVQAAEKYVRECWHPDFPSEQAARALSEPFLAGWAAGVEAAAKVGDNFKPSSLDGLSVGDEIRKLAE